MIFLKLDFPTQQGAKMRKTFNYSWDVYIYIYIHAQNKIK